MSERPLISVVTSTWQRQDLLLETMANIRAQTYRPLEHVIVSDGPHPGLEWLVKQDASYRGPGDHVITKFVELGRNWSSYFTDSYCAAPNVVGSLVASGDYQCPWADDERAVPDHLERLVNLLEETGADFAYPKVEIYLKDQPFVRYIIGTDPPCRGQITHWLARTELLKSGLYPFGLGFASDWACLAQWIEKGATWAFLPEVTFNHRSDHWGQ